MNEQAYSDNLNHDIRLDSDELPIFRKWLVEMLRSNVIEVTFMKTDNTERVMLCTLKPAMLPASELKEDKPRVDRKVSDSVIPVWSIRDNGFRSFRVDRVIGVRFSLTGDTFDTEKNKKIMENPV